MVCSCSSMIWLSTSTSMAGNWPILGFIFFMRVAMPLSFSGMRLHISIHCSSSSCWLNSQCSSCTLALGSSLSKVPGIICIFRCLLIWRTLFQEKPKGCPLVPLSPLIICPSLEVSCAIVAVAVDEAVGVTDIEAVATAARGAVAGCRASAGATCGALCMGRGWDSRFLNRLFSRRGRRPATGLSSGWVT